MKNKDQIAEEAKQIAEETADKIYERYINEKQWTKSGTLTQGEFLAMMREHIQAAIEKAVKEDRANMDARADELRRAAHASEPLRLLNYWYRERGSIAKEAYDEIKYALESNATLQPARASEPWIGGRCKFCNEDEGRHKPDCRAAQASEPWSTLDNVLQMGSNGEVVLCSKLQAIAIRDAHNKDILGTKRIPFYGGVLGK